MRGSIAPSIRKPPGIFKYVPPAYFPSWPPNRNLHRRKRWSGPVGEGVARRFAALFHQFRDPPLSPQQSLQELFERSLIVAEPFAGNAPQRSVEHFRRKVHN